MGTIVRLPWRSPLKDSSRRLAAVAGRLSALDQKRVPFLMEIRCCVCDAHISTKMASWSRAEFARMINGGTTSHGLCKRPECRQTLLGGYQ